MCGRGAASREVYPGERGGMVEEVYYQVPAFLTPLLTVLICSETRPTHSPLSSYDKLLTVLGGVPDPGLNFRLNYERVWEWNPEDRWS